MDGDRDVRQSGVREGNVNRDSIWTRVGGWVDLGWFGLWIKLDRVSLPIDYPSTMCRSFEKRLYYWSCHDITWIKLTRVSVTEFSAVLRIGKWSRAIKGYECIKSEKWEINGWWYDIFSPVGLVVYDGIADTTDTITLRERKRRKNIRWKQIIRGLKSDVGSKEPRGEERGGEGKEEGTRVW